MSSERWKLLNASAFFIFTTLGTFVWPDQWLWLYQKQDSWFHLLLSASAWFYVTLMLIFPTSLLLAATCWRHPLPHLVATTLRSFFALILTAAFLGIPFTFFLFGAFTPEQKALVAALQATCLLLQLLFFRQAFVYMRTKDQVLWSRKMWLYATPVLVFAHWSIGSGIAAGLQAAYLSSGAPYCIADSSHRGGNYGEIDSLFDLRGVKFLVSATGYKSNSRWYFHGILVTQHENTKSTWNWSTLKVAFDPISARTSRLLIVAPTSNCRLRRNFLWSLVTG